MLSYKESRQEYLTAENANRFSIFPILHKDIWENYEKQRKAFWWDTEVVMTGKDIDDWNSLDEKETDFLENILAFFATSDGIVMENLAQRFMSEITIPEARFFFTIQMMIEAIHSLVYTKLLDGYVSNQERKTQLLNAAVNDESVKTKADWALKWITSKNSLAERLFAFACVEGIFFSGSFCAIFWLAERKILPAFTFSNKVISRDEGIHVNNLRTLYSYCINKLSDARAHEIALGALEAEKKFLLKILHYDLVGMNKVKMGQYIDYVASRLCTMFGHAPLFPTTIQPFPFMDRICFDTKENFFETRVSNYQMQTSTEKTSIDVINFDISEIDF